MSDQREHGQGEGAGAADAEGASSGDGRDGTVSEAGSGSLNPETALGGADSVPDTPDVNDALEGGSRDLNEPGDETRDEAQPEGHDEPQD